MTVLWVNGYCVCGSLSRNNTRIKVSLSMHERAERNHKCETSRVLAAVVNASEEKG